MKWLKRFIMWRGYLYRFAMRITHKFNWHYAPPIYPDGDTQLWCKWCGFRQTIKRRDYHDPIIDSKPVSGAGRDVLRD